jgi:hypothetical protein
MKRMLMMAATTILLTTANVGLADGRFYNGGHPYHNGYPFMPPASAYESVRVYPPFHRGVPMYYFPGSYLGGSVPGYYPPATYQYQYAPAWRSGGFYMSAHGAAYSYPW